MTSIGYYQQQQSQKNKNYKNNTRSANEKQRNNSAGGYKKAPRFQNRSNIGQERSNQAILNTDQMTRLHAVMQEPLEVHGRGNFPTLYVCMRRFIRCVIRRLEERGLKVKRVKLNGGAASYVLATKTLPSYNDIDLIFDVDLLAPTSSSGTAAAAPSPSSLTAKFDLIKHSVFDALIEFLPQGVNRSKMCAGSMKTAYVRKMVKVCDGYGDTDPCLVTNEHPLEKFVSSNDLLLMNDGDGQGIYRVFPEVLGTTADSKSKQTSDLWSLISLNNNQGRFLELKFVERMRRQFEFSVDSFQIDLDPIIKRDRLRSYDDDSVLSEPFTTDDDEKMIVKAESMYGDFQLALKHLDQMLIDTVRPELIRGGGLLKYVNLLVRGFRPACSARQCYRMERYMCSRFFIDFGSCDEQQHKLRAYLDNHFQNDLAAKYQFLCTLRNVVDESTVCLMNHELRMSLEAIDQLAYEVHLELCYERQLSAAREALDAWRLSPAPSSTAGSNGIATSCAGRCRRASSAGSSSSTALTEETAPSSEAESAAAVSSCCTQCGGRPQQPLTQGLKRPVLMFIPHNASYWIPVV